MVASHDEHNQYTVPWQPIRPRLQGLPTFVTNRGGHYGFIPGMLALRWLGALTD